MYNIVFSFGSNTAVAIKIGENVVLNQKHNLTVDIWAASRTKRTNRADAPILEFFYGGCWYHGDDFLARTLTQLGYIVVLPNYRLIA